MKISHPFGWLMLSTLSILYACDIGGQGHAATTTTPNDTATLPTETSQNSALPPETARIANIPKQKEVIFKSCAVYAASTDYYFEEENEGDIRIRVSHLEEEKGETETIVPENMLVEGEEGPPGANPDLVGKKFVLIYGENEKVVEIRLSAE